MSPQDMRQTLIARTIQVIANEGLDKTTTKAITAGTGINEAYIYRYFSDKEDLLAKAFDKLDEELVDKAMQHVSIMYMDTMEYEMRCRFYFGAMWKFLLGNREKCLAFVRYYFRLISVSVPVRAINGVTLRLLRNSAMPSRRRLTYG